jgi:flagellar protein FliT
MDAAKYVWWYAMTTQQRLLTELLQLTEEINDQLKRIQPNMNDNEPTSLEQVQALVEKRGGVINQLKESMKQQDFQWAKEDQEKIQKLNTLEQVIQPLMNNLYQSFAKQMDRINQNKQVSKKYFGAYQTMTTDGSFIDKRK